MGKYTTSRGITVEVIPIVLLLQRVREQMEDEEPECPTYTEKVGNAEVEHRITAEIAEMSSKNQPEWWRKYAGLWSDYLYAQQAFDDAVDAALWQVIVAKAIKVDMPEDDAWTEDYRRMGMKVPDDDWDRRIFYLETEVVGTQDDVVKLAAMASGMGADAEEAMVRALSSFQDSLRRAEAAQVPRDETD